MAKAKDLTDMKFGRLTVIERAGTDKFRRALWLCKCDCGNEKILPGGNLTSGHTTSCGCYNREISKEKNTMNLIGEKFGRLTVIEKAGTTKAKKALWICQCECGNITQPIVGSNLINGNTISCGCLQKEGLCERSKQQIGERNPYWKGGITPISKHLRGCTKQWDKNVRQTYDKKCALTGVKCTTTNSTVHHLYGFNMIVQEAHVINNIEIKPQIKDYEKEELQLLENYVLEWHKDTSNGVLLCNEVHNLFHYEYGYGSNTPEQFEEFKQRYLNGEFDKSDSKIA